MGCGSSGNVVPAQGEASDQGAVANGKASDDHHNGLGGNHDVPDDLSTVVLADTPVKAKPREYTPWNITVAFEIPVEEFDGNRRPSNTPPAHLQRLLQPPQPDISLPDIEEKLAVAEQRRQSILQQRAASAQKRAQKMIRSVHDMDTINAENHKWTGSTGSLPLSHRKPPKSSGFMLRFVRGRQKRRKSARIPSPSHQSQEFAKTRI